MFKKKEKIWCKKIGVKNDPHTNSITVLLSAVYTPQEKKDLQSLFLVYFQEQMFQKTYLHTLSNNTVLKI